MSDQRHNQLTSLSLAHRISILEKNYYELIYAVGSKFPNETRHETALRYIRERELASNEPAEANETH